MASRYQTTINKKDIIIPETSSFPSEEYVEPTQLRQDLDERKFDTFFDESFGSRQLDPEINTIIPRNQNLLNEEVSPENRNGQLSMQLPTCPIQANMDKLLLSNNNDIYSQIKVHDNFDLPSVEKLLTTHPLYHPVIYAPCGTVARGHIGSSFLYAVRT